VHQIYFLGEQEKSACLSCLSNIKLTFLIDSGNWFLAKADFVQKARVKIFLKKLQL
jgi:hypothetical protein